MYVYIYTYPSSSEESFQCQTFLAGSIGETLPEKNPTKTLIQVVSFHFFGNIHLLITQSLSA